MGEEYPERLAPFVKAIRAAHPEIKIVGSAGPFPEGEEFERLWSEMQLMGADLVDEHYYRNYEWFLSQAGRYDAYGRSGPKVFAGEYACHADGKKYNHYYASLMEAAFMTGLERMPIWYRWPPMPLYSPTWKAGSGVRTSFGSTICARSGRPAGMCSSSIPGIKVSRSYL